MPTIDQNIEEQSESPPRFGGLNRMSDTQILHDRLLSQLREAVASIFNINGAEGQAIGAAADALTDALAEVLAKLPLAATDVGGRILAKTYSRRFTGQLTIQRLNLSEMADLVAIEEEVVAALAGETLGHA
ncbi:hypothetical protein [Sphingobium fuliginis]|nr:hypothetical protein [Sphingobium fuliginis]